MTRAYNGAAAGLAGSRADGARRSQVGSVGGEHADVSGFASGSAKYLNDGKSVSPIAAVGYENTFRRSWRPGSGGALAPTRIVGELLCMTYLLLLLFRRGIRQNDIRMAEVIGLWACPYLPPADSGFPLRNHCPAVERGVSSVSVPVGNGNRVGRLRIIESVDGDIGYTRFLTKDTNRNSSVPGALRSRTGEYTSAEIFLVSNLVRDGHAVAPPDRSSSARASRTNPSGSPRALE